VTILRGDQLPTIAGPSNRSRKDPFYSRIAGGLAGGARAVFCWNSADWKVLQPGTATTITLGYVEFVSPRQVNLSPRVCRWLDLIHYKHQRPAPTLDESGALVTFGHELTHTILHTRYKGLIPASQEEAFAECVGMQFAPYVSEALGTSLAYGTRLAQIMWNWYKPANFVPGYWSPKCRPNGPWDLDPKDPTWP
jgi:hypothetical protein